jgi:hypothetical protein
LCICFSPESKSGPADGNRKSKMSSYDSIRSRQHIRRHRQADLPGRLQGDDQLKLFRLLDWQAGWLCPY